MKRKTPNKLSEATVVLISCVRKKCDGPLSAKDLYISDWFQKARRYAEMTRCKWYVLSAEYGLLTPDTLISRYDKTLNTMPVAERREWAKKVMQQLDVVLAGVTRVVFLAGERYREFLTAPLRSRRVTVETPMEGMRIGEQLGWLSDCAEGN